MSQLTNNFNDDQTLRNVKPTCQGLQWGRCVGHTKPPGLVLSLVHLIPIKSECYLMPSAYVDGGGHMVANQIKSTHKYIWVQTGCYKDALGPASYFVCWPKNIVKCSKRHRLSPKIWTSVMGTLSRDRSHLSQWNWAIKANVTFERQMDILFNGQHIF